MSSMTLTSNEWTELDSSPIAIAAALHQFLDGRLWHEDASTSEEDPFEEFEAAFDEVQEELRSLKQAKVPQCLEAPSTSWQEEDDFIFALSPRPQRGRSN